MDDDKHYMQPIQLKPSSELIPDEYEIHNGKFLACIFYRCEYAAPVELLVKCMDECDFVVSSIPVNTKEEFQQKLADFAKSITKRNTGVFVTAILDGNDEKCGHLLIKEESIAFKEVWDPFLRSEHLNRKPKIFLFQTILPNERHQFDGVGTKRLYDLAAPGADLLLISRSMTQDLLEKDQFFATFCGHVDKSGDYADLIEIATFSTEKDRPLIVSTLTAKCYLKPSAHRDYNHMVLDKIKTLREMSEKSHA